MHKILKILLVFLLALSGCANGSTLRSNEKATPDTDTVLESNRGDNMDNEHAVPIDALTASGTVEDDSWLTAGITNKKLPFPRVSEFHDDFSISRTIEESGEITESLDYDWSLSSGAYLYVKNGIGMSIQGELPKTDKWYREYRQANPEDTDGGAHPQNIFRLVLLKQFLNSSQEAYFLIKRDNLSASPYRNGSNGLLFFNRYQSSQTLYYTGVRVDGNVTIKKKKNGIYYTLATEKIFPGTYDRDTDPNLLPKNTWLGLKSTVTDLPDGRVDIQVFLDSNRTGNWQLIAEAVDDGQSYGGAVLANPGLAGIRTDFMDVEFDDYRIIESK